MEKDRCVLIGNTFANTMQFVVAMIAISVLFCHKIIIENDIFNIKSRLYKKYRADPSQKRPWNIWFMDNAKQGVSSALAHIYATYIAVILSIDTTDNYSHDECGWFFVQFLIDTVIGVILSFGISKMTIMLFEFFAPIFTKHWLVIGNYNTMGDRRKYYVWLFQVFHWIICSMVARIMCSLLIVITLSEWKKINREFSSMWDGHRYRELVFVVIGMPIIMNSIQFLLTNWYLHWQRPKINSSLIESLNSGIY